VPSTHQSLSPQAIAAQHPKIVRKIKAQYKQFPRSARGKNSHISRPVTVTQLIADLDLFDGCAPQNRQDPDNIDHVAPPDLPAPDVYYGQAGTALLCFRDAIDTVAHAEHPRRAFHHPDPEARMYLLYQEYVAPTHSVSSLDTPWNCLVEYVSTINTVGKANILQDYAAPSPSSIRMRSATGQIVRPVGQGKLTFSFNAGEGTLAVQFQHTPAIATIILSPEEDCERLDYDVYTLSCNRKTSVSSLRFSKAGAQYIDILGTYAAYLPHIPLAAQAIHSLSIMHTCPGLNVSSVAIADERLSDKIHTDVHQILRLCQRSDIKVDFQCCSTSVLQFVQETISDDMTHGNTSPSPILHVRDAVKRTLWHLRTCHPNPDRLVQLSKISTDMPRFQIKAVVQNTNV
jgi:hypothetical protein